MRPVIVSGMVLVLLLWGVVFPAVPAHAMGGDRAFIAVNQAGYLADGPKTALLVNVPEDCRVVYLLKVPQGKVAREMVPSPARTTGSGGETVRVVDFTDFRQPGRYVITCAGLKSYQFTLGDNVFMPVMKTMLRSYYLQRCGVAIDDPLTGIKHPACHRDDASVIHADQVHRAGDRVPCSGGWHDAGDYGKYVATAAVTLGRLLGLFESCPSLFRDGQEAVPGVVLDRSGRPESSNGIPDILDEARVELSFLLSLQREDGAVYRKVAGSRWPKAVSPDQDRQPRYIYGISTPETAKFAAAMAMAARVYRPFLPEFAQVCLRRALRAWAFLERNPSMLVDWQPGDDTGSGGYLYSSTDRERSLQTDVDDRFWAAAELYVTTGRERFARYIRKKIFSLPFTLFEWKDPSSLGMVDYIRSASHEPNIVREIKKKIADRAEQALKNVRNSPYMTANRRIIWGSNKMAAEEGILLFHAYELTGRRRYLEGAVAQAGYLLGMNPFGKSFVTSIGANPVANVSHLFARAIGRDIPGLLVGGPNEQAQAGIAPMNRGLRSYVDDARSYATNEYAIDYNASLITLLGLLSWQARSGPVQTN